MSTLGTWDQITGAIGSTTSAFGGEWGNYISKLLTGEDIGLIDPTKKPNINTEFRFRSEKLRLNDTDDSHQLTFVVDDIDTGPIRKVHIRRMNNPNEQDYMVLESQTQTIINKTIDSDLNTITNIVNTDINASAAIATTKLADSANFLLKTLDNSFGAHYFDITRMTAPSNPAANDGRIYAKQIDVNNDGLFCKIKKSGGFVEVQIV